MDWLWPTVPHPPDLGLQAGNLGQEGFDLLLLVQVLFRLDLELRGKRLHLLVDLSWIVALFKRRVGVGGWGVCE